MWSNLGYPLPLEEGKYWLDNHFVIAFDNTGGQHKLYKYKVFDDLSIEVKPYEVCEGCEFETWEQTVERMNPELDTMVEDSLAVIRKAIAYYSEHKKYIMTSTGKDSTVMLDLVKKVQPDVKVVFNNTSMDCADTYKLVKSHKNWEITNPNIGFYQYCAKNKFIPTRFSRGCCSVFKEGQGDKYFLDKGIEKLLLFMGVRNDESSKRADRQDISHSPKWGNRDWWSCLPIRKWNDFQIWLYTLRNNLEVHPKYKKGYGRVGCHIVCPYATKYSEYLDEFWYKTALDRWRNFMRKVFTQNIRWCNYNCTIDEYVSGGWRGGLYRPEPNDEVLNEFMKYKGFTDKSVALQYFNKVCEVCGKNVRQNEVLAMNLKLHGRNTTQIYCKKHLCEMHEMSKDEWDEAVADFKREGCDLF